MCKKLLAVLVLVICDGAWAVDPICSLPQLQTNALITGKIDVRDAGAVGDANTDDTSSIQKALDCAYAGGGGRTVYFPPGGYKITRGLIVHRAVDLVGEGVGWGSVIYANNLPAGESAINIDGATQTDGWTFKTTIRGLNVDMWYSPGNRAIKINNAYSIRIVDSYIRTIKFGQRATSLVAGVDIHRSNHITLDHVIIFGEDTGQGIGLSVSDSWVTAVNVDVEGHAVCVKVSESAVGRGKLNMIGGYVERFGDKGILFNNTKFNNISGTVIKIPNSSPHGIFFSKSQNNNITGVSLICGTGNNCNAIYGASGNNLGISTSLIQGSIVP